MLPLSAVQVPDFSLVVGDRRFTNHLGLPHLSLVSRLSEFIETVLLVEIQQNVVIFIDEIDSLLSLDFHAKMNAC
jgi:hypothetical protein